MSINIKPLGDRILVEAAEEKEVKKGGIIIPDSAKEKPSEGIVVALGTAGFHYIEGWPWFDGFYMVVTTLTTIGFGGGEVCCVLTGTTA